MELLGLAILFFLARNMVDVVHAVKGTTPPHVEKARLKAQQPPKVRERSPYAEGKPRLRDVAAALWGNAMEDAIEASRRRHDEKRRQRDEKAAAAAEGRKPQPVRPGWRARAKRLGSLILNGPQQAPPPPAEPRVACEDCGATLLRKPSGWAHPGGVPCPVLRRDPPSPHPHHSRPGPAHTPNTPAPSRRSDIPDIDNPQGVAYARNNAPTCPVCDRQMQLVESHSESEPNSAHYRCPHCGARQPGPTWPSIARQMREDTGTPTEGDPMTQPAAGAPTGEAVNYETAMAELDKLEAVQRTHLDHALAALGNVRRAKQEIADTQATYRPAAEAAGVTHESLTALNLDAETVANTGTIADAMPPNAVDAMFAQLEEMEAAILQQVANAEAALASIASARAVLVAKYGDANATVQGELGGDARFLSGSGQVGSYGDRLQSAADEHRQRTNPAERVNLDQPAPVSR